MFGFSLVLLRLPAGVDVLQGHLLAFDQVQVEVQIQLCHRLGETTSLVELHELDGIAALMAAVAVPAGLVYLEAGGLLPVEGAADVAAPVWFEAVVLNDLAGRDAFLDDRSRFHDGHS